MGTVLLEARAFKPFKSDEEYLIAMKEDLAEWLQTMYPHLNIHVENFIERLQTGVALCEHANAVKHQATEYVKKKQAKKVMTRSVTGSLAQARAIVRLAGVKYFSSAKPGTFFARDNVSNFINWCRTSLEIIECLLFESDDLIMKKNEKHVILCLLEVARRGARFGMLAPMLVQMERQIDREIAADQKKLNGGLEEQNNLGEDSDSDLEDEEPVYLYGPIPQIITNDLKGLDEMVRDLVEKCTCPTQFPMIRVSEGKYRIGDTRVLIFVRILRNHVMVRVGGGWDTLSHYLDKHDPCRCKTQHRTTQGARFVNKPGAMDLHGSQVYYNRSATPASSAHRDAATDSVGYNLGPPMHSLSRSRSRSPSHSLKSDLTARRSLSPSLPRRSLGLPTSHQNVRSRSPTPNYTSTYSTKLSTTAAAAAAGSRATGAHHSPNKSLQHKKTAGSHHHHRNNQHNNNINPLQTPLENNDRPQLVLRSEATLQVFEVDNQSDTTSEMSDEGYKSLGITVQDRNKQRSSLCSHNSADDANDYGHQIDDDTDELNDFGLRKTQFSQRIYQESDARTPLPKSAQESTTPGSSPKKLPPPRMISRANSADRMILREPTTNRNVLKVSSQQHQTKGGESGWGTWNGRQKQSRTSIGGDETTLPQTFNRASPNRRSLSALTHHERRASSLNNSPIKGRLRQELLNAVKSIDDDELIAHQVQGILQKYGKALNIVDDISINEQEPKILTKDNPDGSPSRSSRKDSRSDKQKISRIPAPVLHGA